MMKYLVAITTAFVVIGFSSLAFADDEETQFIEFDQYVIDGQFVEPQVSHSGALGQAQFGPISSLEASFLDKIVEDSQVISFGD